MKEENQILKEQDVIRNELLSRYEKKHTTLEDEVSTFLSPFTDNFLQLKFYKEQNNDLIKRLNDFEQSVVKDFSQLGEENDEHNASVIATFQND